jgi:transcriptional regulator with GAF, ATPase, and Fis domain
VSREETEELTALRAIVEAASHSRGEEYLQAFVRNLARLVDAHYAFIAEFASPETTWPGNIRELENVLERAVILSNGPMLEIDPEVFASATAARSASAAPPTPSDTENEGEAAARAGPTPPLESPESSTRNHILAALEKSGWVIDGPRGAAKILSLHPNTLRSRMKKLGIVRPGYEGQP